VTEVRWTTQAADDLQAIYDFIGRDSEQYAQVIIEGILAAIDNLEQFPLLGRTVPETKSRRSAGTHQATESFIELAK
jgi:plasmid stabilization system protein ParE